LENGDDITYDILILAMGADAKRPDFVSKQASNIHVLRDTQDALKLRKTALNSDKAVIVGGGFIGLEVASSMRMAGLVVDLVEFEPRLLARVSSPQISEFFRLLHNKQGVSFYLGTAVTDIIYSETGQARSVKLSSGEILECDVLVFGIGVAPNMNLAKSLGLCVADGVTVDNTYLASDDIYVIGDLAFSQKRSNIRIESVYHAQFSAAVAAASITGSNMPEQEAFWFWSDQYDVKLQIAGILPKTIEAQQIHKEVRSGKKKGSFSVWSWYQDKLVCIEAIGDPQSYMIGKRLLEQDTDISPEMIADETVSLKQLFEKFVANAR
jgi:3-phenylpropionate/trans-cinnamate dioxygenase ferredoxin reductase subunit